MGDNKQKEIHEKGFDLYNKIKIGNKTVHDAILEMNSLPSRHSLRSMNLQYGDKNFVLEALANRDLETIRAISNYYYRVSGIYQRACNYAATMFRYDWYVVPEIFDEKSDENKIVKEFNRLLDFLDGSKIKQNCGEIGLKVIRNGAFYGYKIESEDGVMIQELPLKYCRTRYSVGGNPAIEFNMRFFDDKFKNAPYRMKILNLFPKEFQKGYVLYKEGKLPSDNPLDLTQGWYLLDVDSTVKFSFDNNDMPLFINAIPAILDLDDTQDLDRRRQMQQLLKIIIQRLPLDKNGDLIFDIDEARDIHDNAVAMLKNAPGADVLTTFAEIEDIDMSHNSDDSKNDLANAERAVYNSLGISQNLFNADGNLALGNSILNDEGTLRTLVLQFANFFDRVVQKKNLHPKKYKFRLYMLETTQYNYKELSDKYKSMVQIGYSKMLPQIALGHNQSAILNTAYFENEVLHLSTVMLPPLMSSTIGADDLKTLGGSTQLDGSNSQEQTGRPELPEAEKSDKTLANEASLS